MQQTLMEDAVSWIPVKRLCEQMRIDYHRAREKLLRTDIPRKKLRTVSRDGKSYQMWCIPETSITRYQTEVAVYKRGPYNKWR